MGTCDSPTEEEQAMLRLFKEGGGCTSSGNGTYFPGLPEEICNDEGNVIHVGEVSDKSTKDVYKFMIKNPAEGKDRAAGTMIYGKMVDDKLIKCGLPPKTERKAWRSRNNGRRLMERLLRYENHYSSGAEGHPPKGPSYSA